MSKRTFSRRNLLRGGIAVGATASAATILGIGTSSAAVAEPNIISAGTWGAKPPTSASKVLNYRPTFIVVHHMASGNNTGTDVAAAHAIARACQGWHFDNGWNDSGQQFSVSRGGYVLEGRQGSLTRIRGGSSFLHGIHAGSSANAYSIGIENEGNYVSTAPPAALYNGLVKLCAYICSQYKIGASQIFGHRDYMNTACPGDQLYAKLPQLRSDVAALLGGGEEPPPEAQWPTVKKGATGETVRSVQHLLNHHEITTVVDGDFGPATDTNVKAFQESKDLVVDGSVGPLTWAELVVTVKKGAEGEAVKAVQRSLNNVHGISTLVDGDFGTGTDTSVRSFQQKKGLVVDGIVGPISWRFLVG